MKLNYKRTILVGFAFFLISLFWQNYDATIPVILTNKFGIPQDVSGFIMALDNILAVFMLPIFGALSEEFIDNPAAFIFHSCTAVCIPIDFIINFTACGRIPGLLLP